MIEPVTLCPRARLDLLEPCSLLVQHPQSGTPYDSGIDRLAGLRRFPVKGFAKYLLFYMPRAGGIEVVRVLHGARDIAIVFGTEEE